MATTGILAVIEQDGELVVDSRLIADRLGIQHESFLKTIRKHRERVEARFGHLRFQIGTVQNSVGAVNQVTYVLLSEPQASVLMTLSKNTEQVVECKLELVDAFEKAKQVIRTVIPAQSELIQAMTLELELLKRKSDLATMHGKEYAALVLGGANAVVQVEVPVIEVIDERHNVTFRGQTLTQLRDYLKTRFGIKFKSGEELKRALERAGHGHLIAQTLRSVTSPYIPMEYVHEAIDVLVGGDRQRLIGE